MNTLNAGFWDRWAHRYAQKPIADEAAYQKKLEVTRNYFSAESNVLELGCGTGSTALAHAPFVKRIVAIDISGQMIQIAQQKAAQVEVKNVTFQHAEASSEWAQEFHAVMALSLLHLIDEPQQFLNRVNKALKPGGTFIQNTPVLADTKPWLKPLFRIANLLRLLPPIHLLGISDLHKGLQKAGFDIEYQWFHESADALFIVARKRAHGSVQTEADYV